MDIFAARYIITTKTIKLKKYILYIVLANTLAYNFYLSLHNNDHSTSNNITAVVNPIKIKELNYIRLSQHRNINDINYIYSDVLNYSKSIPFGDNHGRYTNTHETSHGISSEIRSKYRTQYTYPINGIYLLFGKGMLLREPNILITDISKNIPISVRGYRYKTYFIDQTKYWNKQPLYILEEWNCYILGAECAVVDWQNETSLEKTDAVSGALEFAVYSLALAKTVYEEDKNYWLENQDFKDLIEYNLLRAYHVYSIGKNIDAFRFSEQDMIYDTFQTNKELKDLRVFAKKYFANTEWVLPETSTEK